MADDKDNQNQNAPESIQTLKVEVDRTKIEKELQEQLEVEKKAKEAELAEKQKLNEKLVELQKQLDDKTNAEKLTKEQLETIQSERDNAKNSLAKLAEKAFNERKGKYFEQLEGSGLEEEKVNEIKESIKTPQDLDQAEIYLTLIPQMLKKAQELEAQIEEQAGQTQEQLGKEAIENKGNPVGGGTVPLNNPQGTPGNMQFKDYRTAIKQLRKDANDPSDPEKQAKAKAAYDGLWKLAWDKLKHEPEAFGIVQCPVCRAGITEGGKCPDCGFDPANYVQTSSIFGDR